jgi:uncharacterized protein
VTRLEPGAGSDAAGLEVPFEPLPADQIVSGAPATRFVDLDETDARTIGVWEHTPGVSTDVEADEVFVVLSGSGALSFDGGDPADVELRPGVVVRLTEGMRTTWTVRETIRKVYIAP